MNRRQHDILLFFGVLHLLIFAVAPEGLAESQMPGGARIEAISLGIVSGKPRERIEEYRGFVNYVAQKLSSDSNIKGRVVVAGTPRDLASLLDKKKIDFYMESPYPTFLINEQTGAKLLLRRWKGRVSEYRSLLLAMKDSGMTHLEDLLGKIIAFEDPGSTSGYFMPKALLLKKGFKLAEKSSFEANVSAKEIGYLFAHGSEKNIINWILLKKVAAGAFNSNDFDKLDEERKEKMFIVAGTEMVPRHLLSVRRDLDPALVNRLREILLSMHRDVEGKKVLKKTEKTTKFDLLPGGEKELYQKMRELSRILQKK